MVKSLSSNININIAQYIIEPKKIPKKWVKPFAKNTYLANIEYLYSRNIGIIGGCVLSRSNTIVAKLILKKHPSMINWAWLSGNTSKWAYKLLKQDKINWYVISENPSKWAYKLLKERLTELRFRYLASNPSKWARKFNTTFFWDMLSSNPSNWACKILKANIHKIDYKYLSKNPSRWAYKLLNKIDWDCLSENTSRWAYKLLKNNPDKINWDMFASSPYLFKIIKTTKYYKLFDGLLYLKFTL